LFEYISDQSLKGSKTATWSIAPSKKNTAFYKSLKGFNISGIRIEQSKEKPSMAK